MKIALHLICHFLFLSVFAQTTLSGNLLEENTGQPVEFATAYINGTTIGSVSDAKGYFELKNVNFPLDLVVSHLSYESVVVHLEVAPKVPLKIELQARAVDIASVKIVDNDLRQRNVKEFIANFLGLDNFGEAANLTNQEVLQFNRDYKKVKIPSGAISISVGGVDVSKDAYREQALNLKVSARAPLVIDQPLLGYRVRVDLESFQLNYADRMGSAATTYWLGYYFFEPYQVEKQGLQKRFEKNRKKAYFNSPQHFLKSLYEQNLGENGFQLFVRGEDSVTKAKTYERFDIAPYLKYTKEETLVIVGIKDKIIDVLYYPKMDGSPKDVRKKGKGTPLQSLIQLTEEACLIRSDGTMPGFSIRFGGQMAEKKVGAMLPDNYQLN